MEQEPIPNNEGFHFFRATSEEAKSAPSERSQEDAQEDAHGVPTAQPKKEDNTPKTQHHYSPRTCRICLEEVLPSFEPVAEGLGTFLDPQPKVQYISSDPESGRFIRPCKCRGSQAYVHEGCLQEWRYSDTAHSSKTFWECPTCKFKYRLQRMTWSRYIQSTMVQILLTAIIMVVAVFLLGFVADPIINLYFEPGETIASIATGGVGEFDDDFRELDGWLVHFLKGLTSIGVLGFVKMIWVMSPITWWNLRQGGLLGGNRGRRRDRDDGSYTIVIVIGVIAFLFALWSWVRAWTRRTLENASDRVADVQEVDEHEHQE